MSSYFHLNYCLLLLALCCVTGVLWCSHLWLLSAVTSQTPDTRHLHICNQTLILLPAALVYTYCMCVQVYFKIMINTNWSHGGTEPVTISNLCS